MDRTGKTGEKPAPSREERLAEALRRNLHRRKDQARRRKAAGDEPATEGRGSGKPTS